MENLINFAPFFVGMEHEITLAEIYTELKRIERTFRDELDKAVETMAILSNPETMRQLEESRADISRGRVREITSVADLQ